MLRQPDQDLERLVGSAPSLADEESLGLFRYGARLHGGTQVVGDPDLRLVRRGPRTRDPGLDDRNCSTYRQAHG